MVQYSPGKGVGSGGGGSGDGGGGDGAGDGGGSGILLQSHHLNVHVLFDELQLQHSIGCASTAIPMKMHGRHIPFISAVQVPPLHFSIVFTHVELSLSRFLSVPLK